MYSTSAHGYLFILIFMKKFVFYCLLIISVEIVLFICWLHYAVNDTGTGSGLSKYDIGMHSSSKSLY